MTDNRRSWSANEEDVMVSIFEEMVAQGGRCDAGTFRAGIYEIVALKMRERIPNIQVEGKHVHNKLKRLKEKYSAAYDMLMTSGFGWDESNQCVVVDDKDVLDAYLAKHPSKNYTVGKPFPLYPRLSVVFGKDRATGNMAESGADALNSIALSNEEEDTPADPFPTPVDSTSSAHTFFPRTSGNSSGRKRKRSDSYADFINLVGRGLDGLSEACVEVKNLSARIDKLDMQMVEARERLPGELVSLGLTHEEVIKGLLKLGGRHELLHIWGSLNDVMKKDFILQLIKD